MPPNMPVLKNIFYTGASIVFGFILLCSSVSKAFNPFSLGEEFKNKLNSQALLKTTRYFASGPSFIKNQKISIEQFKKSAEKYNYRERTSEQELTDNDFTFLDTQPCANRINTAIEEGSRCIMWMNKDQSLNLIVLKNSVVMATYSGTQLQASLKTQLDPILVAQYRGEEPVMQEETKLAHIPIQCMNAAIAIEDNDFLDHSGVSYTGLARAFIKNVITMRKAQGGSTITQQLVKNYFLTPEKTISRKLKELYMAVRLESEWTKDEILETYLNIIYMGQSGAFQIRGLPAASRAYFGKPIENLNLGECALLAAIINNPGMNHPWKKKEKSQARRNLVLSKMKELNLITTSEYDTALAFSMPEPIELKATETAPYFFDAVRTQADELKIAVEGNSFYTTLDLNSQDLAQKSLKQGISEVTESRKKLKEKKEAGFNLQGVVLTAENSTGHVIAFVGGQSFRQTQFNRALNSLRQIGSLEKPFVYLSGLLYGLREEKNVTPLTPLHDQYFEWIIDKKRKWSPENYDKKFRGEIPYYYALKESLNSPTAQVAEQVGIEKVIEVSQKLGLTSKIPNMPSTALGASDHAPFEILQAYHTLANLGRYQKLTFIQKIVNDSDETLYEFKPQSEQRIDLTESAVLVGMMKETVNSGTAKSSRAFGFEKIAAGKTGTTSNAKDAWFSGFTPDFTTTVWIGFDQNLPTSLTGASGAVPIWSNYMKQITAQFDNRDFLWPESVEEREVTSEMNTGADLPKKTEAIKLIFKK